MKVIKNLLKLFLYKKKRKYIRISNIVVSSYLLSHLNSIKTNVNKIKLHLTRLRLINTFLKYIILIIFVL